MVKHCAFIKTDIFETERYPLMRVWFETDAEAFYWIPKWEELYIILDKAIEVENSNWYQSEWKKILKNIKRVLEKRQTKPFIPRKRRTLFKVGNTEEFKVKDKKLLNKIRKHGDVIKCPNCMLDVHIEETECPPCGYPL
jgi:hypothetical protein